jgi:enoyl-CoA hydratase
MGLVNRVVPDERVLAEALALAREIAGQGRLAVRVAKTVFNAVARQQGDAAPALESIAQAVLFESEEKHRRMGAVLEKRKAKDGSKGDPRT